MSVSSNIIITSIHCCNPCLDLKDAARNVMYHDSIQKYVNKFSSTKPRPQNVPSTPTTTGHAGRILLDLQNKLGTYFPRLYVKLNKTDIIDSSDELRKSHTKKYCRVLGLNLADLTKNINKGLGDNKGITRDVFLSFMVRINDDKDNQITGEYLYKYFSAVYNDTKPFMKKETYSDMNGAIAIGKEQQKEKIIYVDKEVEKIKWKTEIKIKTIKEYVKDENLTDCQNAMAFARSFF